MEIQSWNEAIDGTLRFLTQQKESGQKFIQVDQEVLKGLKAPAPGTKSLARPAVSADKRAAYDKLEAEIKACIQCAHLVSFRKNVVPGVGCLDADIMFVGEAPGADEDAQAEPFVGRAGQLLTKIIKTMGLCREDVFIGNILKCRPDVDTPSGNRKPTPAEMETCLPWLWRQIELIQPKVLIALGDTAVKGLIPDLRIGITKLRGQWLQFRNIPLMPTYHPAYLLRNQSLALKRECWEDMLAAMERANLPISEKQRGFFLSAI
jgi:uracil-DNA glycosylase